MRMQFASGRGVITPCDCEVICSDLVMDSERRIRHARRVHEMKCCGIVTRCMKSKRLTMRRTTVHDSIELVNSWDGGCG